MYRREPPVFAGRSRGKGVPAADRGSTGEHDGRHAPLQALPPIVSEYADFGGAGVKGRRHSEHVRTTGLDVDRDR